MASFFILVFLCGYMFIRLCRVSSYKLERWSIDEINKRIICNFIPDSPQVKPPKTKEERWIMVESIKDDLEYIFGKNWREFLINTEYDNSIGTFSRLPIRDRFYNPWHIAYEVWVSSKGYIDYKTRPDKCYRINSASYGIDLGSVEEAKKSWYPEPLVNREEGRNIRMRACQTIERNLQACHPDLSESLRLLQYNPKKRNDYSGNLVWDYDMFRGSDCIRLW